MNTLPMPLPPAPNLIIESTAELLAYLEDGYFLCTQTAKPFVFTYGRIIRSVPVHDHLVDGHLISKLRHCDRNIWELSR